MGGSGSGGGYSIGQRGSGAGGHRSASGKSCEELRFEETLMAPDIRILKNVSVGQKLNLKEVGRKLGVFVPGESDPLGILGDIAVELIECMKKDVYYTVEIVAIKDLSVQVRIYHAG